MAAFGIFEAVKKWLLLSYSAWSVRHDDIAYDFRAGFLRAGASFCSPIIFASIR